MNKAERQAVHDKTEELAAFMAWLPTVERDELERLLADAVWKDEMPDSELVRYFKLSLKGVDMRSIKEANGASRRKRTDIRTYPDRTANDTAARSRRARART